MWRPTVKCPVCGSAMPWAKFHAGKPWTCPGCLGQFHLFRSQGNARSLCAIVLAVVASYGLGMRGVWFLVTLAVLWFPFVHVCIFVADRIVPTRLEPYQQDSKDPFDSSEMDLFHDRPR